MKTITLPVIRATKESLKGYGLILNENVNKPGLSIPFYNGTVIEGNNIPFKYNKHVVIRTAKILKRDSEVIWIERHVRMTQVFIGLGNEKFAMVLGLPTNNSKIPDIRNIKCFVFNSGTGVMLNLGTWHDFPIAIENPFTCLTINSEEVIEALINSNGGELDDGDVFKIKIQNNLNVKIKTQL